MFERFNENVHRALFFARYEASREASHQVATVHVLLGMLREADETLVDLCESAGIDYDPDVAKWLFEQCGLNPQAGARPLRRLIKLWVEDAAADVFIENRSADEIRLRVRMGDGRPEAAVVDSQGVV